jgi:hypothetical protein
VQFKSADLDDLQGPGAYEQASSSSHYLETACAHTLEMLLILQKAVQDLEVQLGIYIRWEPDHPEWINTQALITMHKYHQAIDHLEGLVVGRLFELTKAHQSGTGQLFLYLNLYYILDIF